MHLVNGKHIIFFKFEEHEHDKPCLLERVKGIAGAEEWLNEYEEGDGESQVE